MKPVDAYNMLRAALIGLGLILLVCSPFVAMLWQHYRLTMEVRRRTKETCGRLRAWDPKSGRVEPPTEKSNLRLMRGDDR